MLKHLTACLKKELAKHEVDDSERLMHLQITPLYNTNFFLHLLVSETMRLKDLDGYLRDIWLECCGHLSAFYDKPHGNELKMGAKLGSVFSRNRDLYYQYDFGSTTELTIKLAGRYSGTPDLNEKISLLSRNSMPIIPCDECGEMPAVEICGDCAFDGEGWLCEKCARDHECGEEMLIPVTNSPRSGVCGYADDTDKETDLPDIFLDQASPEAKRKRRQANTGKKSEALRKKRSQALEEMIRFFCKKHLDDEFEGDAIDLIETVSENDELSIERGKIEIWAAAIVYTLARLNSLFHPGSYYHLSADTICDFFRAKKPTVAAKATLIEEACDLWEEAEEDNHLFGFDPFFSQELPLDLELPEDAFSNLAKLLSDSDFDLASKEAELEDVIWRDLKSLQPGELMFNYDEIMHLLLTQIGSRLTNSFGDQYPMSKLSLKPDTKEDHQARRELELKQALEVKREKQQQEIAREEKNKIDHGQLTIFDD